MNHKRLLGIVLILLFPMLAFSQASPMVLAEATLKIGGLGEEKVYFGFSQGDKIDFSFQEVNGKELKEIEIAEYPSSSKFMDYKSTKIDNKIIEISNTGIYVFRFSNSAIGGRICKYKISRIPSGAATPFNSTVYWKKLSDTTYYTVREKYIVKKGYVPKVIQSSADFYVNSGSNATFMGGKSRITIPVTLPPNTVEWYYQFSASRDKEEIARTKSTFNLLADLSRIIDKTGALGFGIDALTQPPGADFCDIYLLDFNNSRAFEAKAQYSYFTTGTRENIKSGIVKMQGTSDQPLYIGIKNPDNTNGINVVIEIVSIVYEEQWGERDVQKYKVKNWEEPFLK